MAGRVWASVAEILLSWASALVPVGTPCGLHLPMPGQAGSRVWGSAWAGTLWLRALSPASCPLGTPGWRAMAAVRLCPEASWLGQGEGGPWGRIRRGWSCNHAPLTPRALGQDRSRSPSRSGQEQALSPHAPWQPGSVRMGPPSALSPPLLRALLGHGPASFHRPQTKLRPVGLCRPEEGDSPDRVRRQNEVTPSSGQESPAPTPGKGFSWVQPTQGQPCLGAVGADEKGGLAGTQRLPHAPFPTVFPPSSQHWPHFTDEKTKSDRGSAVAGGQGRPARGGDI